MKLSSVNVSLPVEVEYNDMQVSTGIFKKPVFSSVTVSEFNLAGDKQADLVDHGGSHKAVYAFATEQYDYWRQALNRPELHYGQFGENLTISGLKEESLCIGDQIQIGDCILEITQPRVPCLKLGIAFDLNTMPKHFIQHAHTGIYFRVIKSREIKQGDDVVHYFQHPKRLSVNTLFTAYFDKSFVDAEKVMKTAAEINELSGEWREKVLARLAKV